MIFTKICQIKLLMVSTITPNLKVIYWKLKKLLLINRQTNKQPIIREKQTFYNFMPSLLVQ